MQHVQSQANLAGPEHVVESTRPLACADAFQETCRCSNLSLLNTLIFLRVFTALLVMQMKLLAVVLLSLYDSVDVIKPSSSSKTIKFKP